jgi:hypothetical protein
MRTAFSRPEQPIYSKNTNNNQDNFVKKRELNPLRRRLKHACEMTKSIERLILTATKKGLQTGGNNPAERLKKAAQASPQTSLRNYSHCLDTPYRRN